MALGGVKPSWLTFDCYGTLIQWDEGLLSAVEEILARRTAVGVDAHALLRAYDRYEHQLEQRPPYRRFREVVGSALELAMDELQLAYDAGDIDILTTSIARMPPFPEVAGALAEFKRMGFKLCVISNTDDDIIAGNVAQLGGHIDRVITAQAAQAYKPAAQIFEFAHRELAVSANSIVHICASPHLDLAAARDMGFRCVWINRGSGRAPLADYTPDAEFSSLDRVPGEFSRLGWA